MTRFRLFLLSALILSLVIPAASVGAPPANDYFFNARDLSLNVQFGPFSNAEATISNPTFSFGEAGVGYPTYYERYTPAGTATCDDRPTQMASTVWFRVPGTGGPIVLSAFGNFDTILAVYGPPNNQTPLGCNDDGSGTNGYLTFNSTAGVTHLVQVGGYYDSPSNTAATGSFDIAALTNNNRANAETIGSGVPNPANFVLDRTNVGATVDPGETLDCGGTPYNSTVWFRYVAPDRGKITFHASRFNLAVSVYRGGQRIACDGKAAVLSASTTTTVSAGDELFVQVGGVPQSPGANNQGNLSLHTIFERGCDAKDVPDNRIDENCDNYLEFDKDNDKYVRYEPVKKPSGYDCNDNNPRINPKRKEIPGNRVDENCDKRKAPARLLTTRVSDSWVGSQPVKFKILKARKGSAIKATCRGSGCPFDGKTRRVKRKGTLSILPWFKGATLGSGAKLQVKVVPPSRQFLGIVKTYKIRRNVPPTPKTSCITRAGKKRRCPS